MNRGGGGDGSRRPKRSRNRPNDERTRPCSCDHSTVTVTGIPVHPVGGRREVVRFEKPTAENRPATRPLESTKDAQERALEGAGSNVTLINGTRVR